MKDLRLLVCAVAAFMFVGPMNAASAAPSPVKHQPTLLWKTYPLVQHPSSPRLHVLADGSPQSFPLVAPGGSGVPSPTLLLLLFGSATAVIAGLLIVSSLANATGSGTAWREAPPDPRQATSVETCNVMLRHGYLKHQFYAALSDEVAAWPLALSPFFRLRHGIIRTEQAATALESLIVQLEQEGWSVVSEGPRWYDRELERPRRMTRR